MEKNGWRIYTPLKKNRAKVKIKSPIDSMEYYFYIKLSRVKDDSYLLLFTDITSLEKDKDMIRKTCRL